MPPRHLGTLALHGTWADEGIGPYWLTCRLPQSVHIRPYKYGLKGHFAAMQEFLRRTHNMNIS